LAYSDANLILGLFLLSFSSVWTSFNLPEYLDAPLKQIFDPNRSKAITRASLAFFSESCGLTGYHITFRLRFFNSKVSPEESMGLEGLAYEDPSQCQVQLRKQQAARSHLLLFEAPPGAKLALPRPVRCANVTNATLESF
jgi:hypothetical protein